MRAPRLSPGALRRIALVNVVLLVAIIVSGATVRLTRSGLGCADWPNCSDTKLVDVSDKHSAIEQLNRIFSGLIGIPLGLAVLAAYWRQPRRRDLVNRSWLLFGLFWMEAVVGGISVKVQLAWFSVTSHFLLAIALVGIALTVLRRAGEGAGPYRPLVPRAPLFVARAVYVLTIWVLVLGTLVTAAGPHGGDDEASRLHWPLGDVARVHGFSVDVLVALTIVLAVMLVRARAPRAALTWITLTILAMVAQGVLGYVQYWNEIPALLVGFHVFGAVCVFIGVQQLQLELRAATGDEPEPASAGSEPTPALSASTGR